jgi:hypothetical protein
MVTVYVSVYGYGIRFTGVVAYPKRNLFQGFKPFKTKLLYAIFNNSVRTAKKTQHFTVTKINRLTLFKEVNAVIPGIIRNQQIQIEEFLVAKVVRHLANTRV